MSGEAGTTRGADARRRARRLPTTAALHPTDNADLCEVGPTQELQEDFFISFTSPAAPACGTTTAAGVDAADACVSRSPSPEEEEEEGDVWPTRTAGHHAQQSQHPLNSSSSSSSSSDEQEEEEAVVGMLDDASDVYWPHPHPPPRTALPHPQQTRIAFHTQRYGAFIKAYLGLSDSAVEQAQRRGRGICMIGVRKAATSSSHGAAVADSVAAYTPSHHRRTHHRLGEPVRVQRAFHRHSVLAVEGDAVFSTLMDRAEVLYGVAQQRLDAAATGAHAPSPPSPPLYPPFRKLPRVAAPYLQPNARCIALHYGLPSPSPHPRASLMAVVCTTRLEEGAEVHVLLESYYRCLDEVAWYRRCYDALNRRCGGCVVGEAGGDLRGDVYTGVRRFVAWPSELAYYHGVGRRHASPTAAAAFPCTLVDVRAAPELGEGQLGIVATAWLPYGTCLLYCGPSVATRQVERLVRERGRRRGDGAGEADAAMAEAEEDLSFASDDTYALGLGRHGVCFGQGLTRYINHRYNTSRFGNVELCSVMLSVPSEFAPTATAPANNTHDGTSTTAADGVAVDTSEAAAAAAAAAAAVARRPHRRRRDAAVRREAAASVVTELSGGGAVLPRQRRRPARRRAPQVFLEERSVFVTIPFFLVTTDVPPGTPLLAWTYGEDYDAKLERHAVADGHLVPYADAALLNRRLAQPTAAAAAAAARLQRYTGDYRFALGVGDVVWRRRPIRIGPAADVCVPPPEEDLFVVVQTRRSGAERVLLRPLQRIHLASRELGMLVREQQLDSYVSPHVSCTASSVDWVAHWAVFRLTDTSAAAPAPLPASTARTLTPAALARHEEALRTCVVATTETVGLLLMDIDYSAVHRTGGDVSGDLAAAPTRGAAGRVGGDADDHRIILVNLDDLHHATALVRTSPERAAAVPPLCSGLLWPLYAATPRHRDCGHDGDERQRVGESERVR
ncbi:hypothetical protein NESM_000277800 [Novymonas esmeraldas]|uniref:SET domain-containing protein n=1 Tax=Novymonas esmeraldas TaxID=1808958 RepID=A0AAW0FBC5_9TRYP